MTVSEDFTGAAERYRAELLAHCYRMLGSADEAEDLVQETYLRAWRSYDGFEGRSSMRTWLYRIATNACLTAIERRGRRPLPSGLGAPSDDPATPVVAAPEVPWLQPLPDVLLAGERGSGRRDRVAGRDAAGLRRGAAIPVRPAARDAHHAGRARVAGRAGRGGARHHDGGEQRPAAGPRPARRGAGPKTSLPSPPTRTARAALERFAAAIENADAAALAELLREDVALEMPPIATWFTGRAAVTAFVAAYLFTAPGWLRPVPVMANGQPAIAVYGRQPDGTYHAHAVIVPTITATGIARMDRLPEPRPVRLLRPARAVPWRRRCRRRTRRYSRGPTEQGAGAPRFGGQLRACRRRARHCAATAASHPVPGLGPGNAAGPCQRLNRGAAPGDNRRRRQRQRSAARLSRAGA